MSIITHANELRLIYISSASEMVSLITSAKVSDKFFTIFSMFMIPADGNTALIVCINNESVIYQVEYLNNKGWHCFLELVSESEFPVADLWNWVLCTDKSQSTISKVYKVLV